MDQLLENVLPFLGVLLCLLAMVQFMFWGAQSWQLFRFNQQRFQLTKSLLQQQIESARLARQSNASQTNANGIAHTREETAERIVEIDESGDWKGFRSFHVTRIESETDVCKSIYLKPVDQRPISSFRGGQHLPIRFMIDGEPVVRCYSISNGPGKSEYRISVKKVPAAQPGLAPGRVSHFVNDQLAVGDIVEAKSPSGSFFADDSLSEPLILLAGGIGITPMISTLEEIFASQSSRPVILFYGARNRADQAFKTSLDQAAENHSNFHVIHCYSEPGDQDQLGSDYHVAGYVTLELLQQVLPNNNCEFLLCGPPPFIESLTQSLDSWGVPDEMVKLEAFGPASRKHSSRNPAPSETTNCKVTFLKSGKSVAWDGQHDSLLEMAEAAGIELDSGCRSGACGTCLTRVLHGSVRHDAEVDCESDECLVCVAQPNSDLELDA